MNKFGTQLRVAFYNASDGPRVMIFGSRHARFHELAELFLQLSQSTVCAELSEQPFLVAFDGLKIKMMTLVEGENLTVSRFRRLDGESLTFEWVSTTEEWNHISELVRVIDNYSTPTHQYLTSYPTDDATVVVSKDEYSDDLLEGH